MIDQIALDKAAQIVPRAQARALALCDFEAQARAAGLDGLAEQIRDFRHTLGNDWSWVQGLIFDTNEGARDE